MITLDFSSFISKTWSSVWPYLLAIFLFGIIIAIVLMIAWLGSVLSSCSVMGTMGANSLI